MKIRMRRDLYAMIRARADLLGVDVSEVARRALRMARRAGVAELLSRESATREDSESYSLDLAEPYLADKLCTARIRWALDVTAPHACCHGPDLECDPAAVEIVGDDMEG